MYKELIDPTLNLLDSEFMHVATRRALRLAERIPGGLKAVEYLGNGGPRFFDTRLAIRIGDAIDTTNGFMLDNLLIVGAGWDKVGDAVLALAYLGFAGVAVGTVLPYAQRGNDKPRQFMLAPGVAWNALGFNSPGMGRVERKLRRYRSVHGRYTPFWNEHQPQGKWPMRIGISVGRNRDVENKDAARAHHDVIYHLFHYADWFEHAISSPNTPDLRALQDKEYLIDILQAGNEAMDRFRLRKPVFVKASPDLSFDAALEMVRIVIDNGATGIIFGNTTNNDVIKHKYGERWCGRGGLSGDDSDFRALSTKLIAHVYRETNGAIMLWGAGDVKDTDTALEKIMAGASALQIVTAIRGEGPRVASNINRGLVAYMEKHGAGSLSELVGVNVR
jgi:dihydroorotate dehydrogenase